MTETITLVDLSGAPDRIGSYRIVRKIGEGGMGAVYEAEQESPRRRVALKIVRAGSDSEALRARFAHEAQILGQLQHPGIAQIFEAGTAETAQGLLPFFAMELVDGQPLNEFAEARRLDARARVELALRVCDALQHAHEKGVIHRDLKPANILVDATGQPKILDFGVARATNADVVAATMHTETGQMLGTVPYMSPEQVSANPDGLDRRSDVYALGVVLYELLAGRMPYDLRGRMLHEAVRMIREVDPAPLSSTSRLLRGDLETIVGKALEKEPSRRYASVGDLAADLARFLRQEPIVARPPSALYQLRKFTLRHRVLVSAAAAIFVVLAGGAVVSATQAFRAMRAEKDALANLASATAAKTLAETREKQARIEASKLEAVNAFLEEMLSSANPNTSGASDVTVRAVTEESARGVDAGFFKDQPAVEASVKRTLGAVFTALAQFERAEPYLRASLAYFRENDGKDSVAAADAEYTLARLAFGRGKIEECASMAEHAHEIHRAKVGEESRSALDDLVVIASVRYLQGALDEAIAIRRTILDVRERLNGEDSLNVAIAKGDLGFLLHQKGDLAEAEGLYLESLRVLRETDGSSHPRTAHLLLNLGRLYVARRLTERAREVLEESLAALKAAFGDDHPSYADSLAELGGVLSRMRRSEEAEPMSRRALEIRRRALGEHQDVANSLTELSSILLDLDRVDEAEAAILEAIDIRTRVFGDRSAGVADGLRRLATIALHRGDSAAAELRRREALAIFGETIGTDHPDYATEQSVLARLVRARGELAEAESLLREALATQVKRIGATESDTLQTRDELARTLLEAKKWDDAEPVVRACIEAGTSRFGADHVSVAHANVMLGRVLAAKGHFEDAAALMLPAWEKIRASKAIWLETKVLALERITALYDAWGKPDEAAKWRAMLEEHRAMGSPTSIR